MFTSTMIRTARPFLMAAALAAAGLAGSAFVAETPAFARGGGNGGGGGGGGDDGAGGGGEGSDGIYAVFLADRERADALTHVPPTTHRPRNPRQPPTVNVPRQRIMYTETTYCGGGSIRIVYDVNGDPMRYLCVRGR